MHGHILLMFLLQGRLWCEAIRVATELSIAEHLKEGAQDVERLAEQCGVQPAALYRMLRSVAALGVFREEPGKRFSNTPLSELLRRDVEGSMYDYARYWSMSLPEEAIRGLNYSVETGNSAFSKNHPGESVFDLYRADPELQRTWDRIMSKQADGFGRALCEAVEFEKYARIVDVGGGTGKLAAMIKRRVPASQVTLLDTPHVIERAREFVRESSVSVDVVPGDMFEKVPGPADAIILMRVLIDWDDELARRILLNCRDALDSCGTLVVCDFMVTDPSERAPDWTRDTVVKLFDLVLLTQFGSKMRTILDVRRLLDETGFRLLSTVVPDSPQTVLVAERID